ncbi:Fumarylacetoacetase [Trichoderma simmonsii]|uniref:Fumarylacetoacetase n=1 Tax=Trichoderma simmonsii TaxID=1491479 RepID=A0A8G0L925_9HYPO|nr:Fumarylacetoacetase [Trichoderma simmonsii]
MPTTESWLLIDPASHFSLANIPFGIISTPTDSTPRPAVAIGNYALDLHLFAREGGFALLSPFESHAQSVFNARTLNAFAALGRSVHKEVRKYLQEIFCRETPYPSVLKTNEELKKKALIPLKDVQNHLPLEIGDYTDFFAGKNHAYNIGVLFRGKNNALQPNYVHLPVAYHGRASSVVVSGTALRRPSGQILFDTKTNPAAPKFSPCMKLDIELELGMFICKGNDLGSPIDVNSAEQNIFGYVLMNDWSARDIQMFEYIPLGPFNAKNFGTTISPWVVLADTLAPFATHGIKNDTTLQKYLQEERTDSALDINLQVDITTSKGYTTTITRTNAKNLVWSWPQMIAHHSISGCSLRTGDLFGSGTISGTEPKSQGSLLEQIQGGTVPMKLEGDEERKFLEDGDTITIKGWSGEEGSLVGFGECSGTILPAVRFD